MDSEIDILSVSAMRITYTDGSNLVACRCRGGSTSTSSCVYVVGILGAIAPSCNKLLMN